MSGFWKRLCVVLVAILVGVSSSNAVFGLNTKYMDEFSQNDILFYDPDECEDGSDKNSNKVCTIPSGSQITWIGDSYSVGSIDLLNQKFSGVDYNGWGNDQMDTSYIWSGKTVNTDVAGPSGLKILRNIVDAGKLRPYLVFALGTNSGWTEGMMNEFLELVGDDTNVILVTSETYPSKHLIENQTYTFSNDILRKAAEEHDNIYIADWAKDGYQDEYFDVGGYSCVLGEPGYDNCIHPTANGGYDAWTDVIKNALPKSCATGLLPGNNIEEKIWNWFVKADIPGVSDNPAAIAGILGNLYIETGYNPYMAKGGYYGLHMNYQDYGGIELRDKIIDQVGDYWDDYVQNNRVSSSGSYWPEDDNYYRGYTAEKNLELAGASEEQVDKAVELNLEHFVNTSDFSNLFLDGIDYMDNRNGIAGERSFAELFVVAMEKAVSLPDDPDTMSLYGQSQPLEDNGIWNYVYNEIYPSGKYHDERLRYQGIEQRRNAGESVYEAYGSGTTTLSGDGGGAIAEKAKELSWQDGRYDQNHRTTGNGVGTANEAYQDIAKKYGLDANIACSLLVVLAIRESVDPDFMKNEPIDSSAIEDYITNDSRNWQPVMADKVEDLLPGDVLINSSPDAHAFIYVGDGRIAEAMWMSDGDAGFPPSVIDWHWGQLSDYNTRVYRYKGGVSGASEKSNSSNICGTSNKKSVGAAKIAEVATQMAWPVIKPEFPVEEGHIGECAQDGRDSDTYNNWIEYPGRGESRCDYTPRKLYRDNYVGGRSETNVFNNKSGLSGRIYMDCSWFVGNVMTYVFGRDYGFPVGGPGEQKNFMASHPEDWQLITNNNTTDDLRAGDVLVYHEIHDDGSVSNHIMLYVGDYGGSYGEWAEANADYWVGMIYNREKSWAHFDIYRYIGSALGGDEVDQEGGLTYEQAKEFMMNYGENKNNSSLNVAGSDQWYISCAGNVFGQVGGSNCVTFSIFFIRKFAEGVNNGAANGGGFVGAMSGDIEKSNQPSVWSVFSWGPASWGHTGIILGYHDGEWIVGHASCCNPGAGRGNGEAFWGTCGDGPGWVSSGSGYVLKSSDINVALKNGDGYTPSYAHINKVNTAAISSYLENGE